MRAPLDKLYALAVRHGINPIPGQAAAERALCDAWGEYAKTQPPEENTLTSANAFVAGWLARGKFEEAS